MTSSSRFPAVVVEGSHADKRCDLLPVDGSEFRQLRNEAADEHGSDARNCVQKLRSTVPLRVLVDEHLQSFIHLLQSALQEADWHIDIVLRIAAQRHTPVAV